MLGDADSLGHLRVALAQHRAWWRSQGGELPQELAALAERLAATGRQEPPGVDREAVAPDAEAVSIRRAARLLDVSERTVERRVADGKLPSFMLGGRRLIAMDAIREITGGAA